MTTELNRTRPPRVTAVVLNHGQYEMTEICLRALEKAAYPQLSIVVVDHESIELEADRLSAGGPNRTVLRTLRNLGVAGGRNLGASEAIRKSCDYLLFIDNDAELAVDAVGHLVNEAERDIRLAAVGPKIYYMDRPACVNTLGGRFSKALVHRSNPGSGRIDDGTWGYSLKADWLSGCCSMIRRSAFLHVGPFDEDYSPYSCEDVDWGIRARSAGYSLRIAPEAVAWHKDAGRLRNTGTKYFYAARGRVILIRKHARIRFGPLPWVFLVVVLVRQCVSRQREGSNAFWRETFLGALSGVTERLRALQSAHPSDGR